MSIIQRPSSIWPPASPTKRLTCSFLVQPLLNLIIFVIEMALFARLTSRFNAYYDKRPGMHPPFSSLARDPQNHADRHAFGSSHHDGE